LIVSCQRVPVAGSKREIRVSVPAVWLSNGYQFSPAAMVRPPMASMLEFEPHIVR